MEFLEKDLEEVIYYADRELLEKKGLIIRGKILRQLRIGNYGIADLVTFQKYTEPPFKGIIVNPTLLVTIYELKKDSVGISAFLQAVGYAKGVQSYLYQRGFKFDVIIDIVLIGKKIDSKSTFPYLIDMIPSTEIGEKFLSVFTYNYDINGINFIDRSGYLLTDEGFKL